MKQEIEVRKQVIDGDFLFAFLTVLIVRPVGGEPSESISHQAQG